MAVVPYWVAAQEAGEITPWLTVLVHVLGSATVLLLLLVPFLRSWVDRHVAAGR